MTTSTLTRSADPKDALRRALGAVPGGEYALLEAAIAWHHYRPAPTGPARRTGGRAQIPPLTQRYLPLVEVDDELVAARLCRVLSELTWAVVTGSGHRWRVEVPGPDYHLVVRALSGTLRHARRELGADLPVADTGSGVAAAVWRMGLLICGVGAGRETICLRAGAGSNVDLLVSAAAALGVGATVDHGRGEPTVLVCHSGDVRRLVNAALTNVVIR